NHIDVCKTQLKLFGNDIKNHLKDCDKCILLALSLGTWADRTCAKYSALSQTDSLIFDGCMTELIEQLADQTCFELQKQYGAITSRFGPGYGDLPLNIQKSFINIIGADKKMGITVVNNLMIPLKTITAVIGIYNKDKIEQKNIKLKKCINKCDSCENKCEFYKP
ncbi:MAG: methionine synthase, partial [Oscillospiraceae bacterium]